MIIQTLVEDDVLVVDFFDKVRDGTFVGGNLSTAIKTAIIKAPRPPLALV